MKEKERSCRIWAKIFKVALIAATVDEVPHKKNQKTGNSEAARKQLVEVWITIVCMNFLIFLKPTAFPILTTHRRFWSFPVGRIEGEWPPAVWPTAKPDTDYINGDCETVKSFMSV